MLPLVPSVRGGTRSRLGGASYFWPPSPRRPGCPNGETLLRSSPDAPPRPFRQGRYQISPRGSLLLLASKSSPPRLSERRNAPADPSCCSLSSPPPGPSPAFPPLGLLLLLASYCLPHLLRCQISQNISRFMIYLTMLGPVWSAPFIVRAAHFWPSRGPQNPNFSGRA
jgi:hypothetical protein